MAIRLKSFRTMSNAGTSLTMPAFPDIATDDFILVTFGKDGNTGSWTESGSSDYTVVTGLPSTTGAVNATAYYRKATSGSEVPRVFDSGVSDDCGGYVTVWEGVDTTTPLADQQPDGFGSSVGSFTATAMTTTANNSVVAWFAIADNTRGLDLEPGLMGFNPPWINGQSGINVNFAWTVQKSSGTTITPTFGMSGAETGQLIGFCLSPASATDAPPYLDHANNPPSVIQTTLRGDQTNGAYGGGTFDPTGTVTAIDGVSTTYDAITDVEGGGGGGLNDGVSQVYSSSDTGLRIAGWSLTSRDLSGEVLSIQMGCYNLFSRFASLADKGFVFGLRSGTVDYMFWTTGGVNSTPKFDTRKVGIEIDIDGGYEIDEIGTFDPTDVTGIVFGGNRTYAGGTINLVCTEFHTIDRAIALGGSSTDPATMQLFVDGVAGNYMQTIPIAGLSKQKVGIGDGSTPTYWKDDSAVMAGYTANDVDNSHQVSDAYAADLEINASANCTMDFTGQVWKGKGSTPLTINASSSASATYITEGWTIIDRAVTFRNVFTASGGGSMTGCTYTSNNADLTGGWVFDNTLVTVTSQAELTDVSNGTFRNRDGAGESAILITGNQSGTWTDKSLTVSNNTYDIEYSGTTNFTIESATTLSVNNSSSGVLTIDTPTITLTVNSSESSSDIKIFETSTQTIEASATGTTASTTTAATYDWTVQKAGFLPQRGTAVVLGASSVTVDITLVEDPVYNASHGLTFTTDYSYDPLTRIMTIVANQEGRDLYSASVDDFISETTLRNCPFPLVAVGPDRIDFTAVGYYNSAVTVGATIDSGDVTFWKGAGMEWEHDTTGNPTKKYYSIKSSNTLQASSVVGYTQVVTGTPSEATLVSNQVNQVIQFFEDTDGNGTPDYNYTGHLLFKGFKTGYYQARWDVINDGGVTTLEPYEYNISLLQNAIAGTSGDQAITIATLTDHTSSPLVVGSKNFDYEMVDPGVNDADDMLAQTNYDVFNAVDTSISGTLYTSYQAFDLPDMIVEAGSNIETEYGYFEGDGAVSDLSGVYLSRSSADHPGIARFQSNDGTYYTPAVTANATGTNLPDDGGGDTNLQILNLTALSASSWAATTAYTEGDLVLRTTGIGSENVAGLFFRCTTGGTSGGSEPTWVTTTPGVFGTSGSETTDNTVTWECFAALLYDADPASTGWSDTYIDGYEFNDGETARMNFAHMNAGTSFELGQTTAAVSSLGFSFDGSLFVAADSIFATNAIDGSTRTEFTADYTDTEIDVSSDIDSTPENAYAWYCYNLTTSEGMYKFWSAVTAIDTANYRNNAAVASIKFDNTTTGSVSLQGSGARFFRDDDANPVKDPTTSGYGVALTWELPVYAYDGGGGGFTASDRSTLNATATQSSVNTVDTNVDSILVDTGTTIPAQITALNDIAATDIVSGGAINTTAGAVDNVTTVATTTTNTDMRGTDSANTVVPDNASITAIKDKTDNLTFTKANELDSNIQSVNDVTVAGTGAEGDEWGP